jgi:alpha-L-fucosidase
VDGLVEGEGARLALFRQRRFGLFVHWGLYALPARNEWLRHRERMSNAEYQQYFDRFYPDLYDPDEWAEHAAAAGARYLVITTKHHDGFCLWDTRLGDYRVTETPWRRDLIHPLVQALRKRGLGVGFYHSLIDWHHPDFPIDGLHPERDNAQLRETPRDIARYREYLHGQVRELLTGYGDVDTMWFDFSYADLIHEGQPVWGGKGAADWDSERLLGMVRQLQPGILVNDRTGLPGDFVTPEQYQPSAPIVRDGRPVPWEACQTLNGSWGYDRDNVDFKSPDLLLRMLVDTVAKDGNLLLNVGPTARGEFDPRAVDILRAIGRWLRLHGRAIYDAGPSRFTAPPDCRYTQRGDRLYLHLFAWPFEVVHLTGLADRLVYAQFLHDGSQINWEAGDPDRTGHTITAAGAPRDTATLRLPVRRPDVTIPVVELFLR